MYFIFQKTADSNVLDRLTDTSKYGGAHKGWQRTKFSLTISHTWCIDCDQINIIEIHETYEKLKITWINNLQHRFDADGKGKGKQGRTDPKPATFRSNSSQSNGK